MSDNTSTITVRNESGQVTSYLVDPADATTVARAQILRQRIARGELMEEKSSAKSARPGVIRPLEDYQTGLVDERGDLLKSVHGGGLDPDADGDALGQPSGSKAIEGAVSVDTKIPVGDSHPAAGAIEQPVEVPDPDGAASATDGDSAPAKRTRRSSTASSGSSE